VRRIALAAAALATSLTLIAAPAFAAAPVAYAITWDSTTLYQLEPGEDPVEIAAAAGPVAVTGLDFDDAGEGYAVTFDGDSQLWAINVSGTATLIGTLTDDAELPVQDCTALDYTAGVISVACDDANGESDVFGTVDPETAVFTQVQLLPHRVASIAYNPIDGVMYGFAYDGPVLAIGDGVTEIGSTPDDAVLWGADFALDGTLWAAVDEPLTTVLDWNVVSFDQDGYDPDEGEFIENISVYEEAPAVEPTDDEPEPQPTLAETGTDNGTVVTAGLAAALTLLAGAALTLVARRSAREREAYRS
jgi:hypothetical protein